MSEVKRCKHGRNFCLECHQASSELSAAQSELAALREELATLQSKHERTELALSGSMKALTRVDNMWKKRWLEKTGEPAIALVVDDEFKAMFEEIKGYRQRLTAAEQRNAELDRDAARYRWLRGDSGGQDFVCLSKRGEGMDEAIDAYLKPTESGASE